MRGQGQAAASAGEWDVVMGIIAVRPRRLVWKGRFGVRVLAREAMLVVGQGMEKGDKVLRFEKRREIAFTSEEFSHELHKTGHLILPNLS